jgi:hypothetical protein
LTAQDFELIDDPNMLPPAHTKIQVIHHTSQSDDNDEDDSNDADDEEERNLHRYANKPIAFQSHLRNKRP